MIHTTLGFLRRLLIPALLAMPLLASNAPEHPAVAYDRLAERLEGQALTNEASLLRKEAASLKAHPVTLRIDPRHLAPIPAESENWYFTNLLRSLDVLLAKSVEVVPRAKLLEKFPTPNGVNDLAEEAGALAWAFTHPRSPRRGQALVFDEWLKRMEMGMHAHTGGNFLAGRKSTDNNYNIFPWTKLLHSWAVMKAAAPDLLPPSLARDWEALAVSGFDHQRTAGHETAATFRRYFNIDARYMMMLAYGAEVTGRREYAKRSEEMLDALVPQAYPDGAFAYIYGENESFSYHQSDLYDLACLVQLTGNRIASNLLVASTNYYPLSMHTGGVSEYSTVPNWKTTWNAAGVPLGPDLVAFFARDGRNAYLGNQARRLYPDRVPTAGWSDLVLGASCFPAGVAETAPSTNFLVFDRNVQGPRGRFGRFGWILDARNRGAEHPGKLTHVSLQITDEPWRLMPLDSALMTVGSRFRFREGKTPWADQGYCTIHEKDVTLFTDRFASLSTRYDHVAVGYGQSTKALPGWEGSQAWLATPRRLVGFVSLENSKEDKAFDLAGVIKLGYGAAARSGTWTRPDGSTYTGPNFIPKSLVETKAGEWSYGSLRVRVHAHNYGEIRTNGKVGALRDDRPSATEIILIDDFGKAQSVPKGTRKSYVVEFFPEWEKPARVTARVEATGPVRIEMADGDGDRELIYNPAKDAVAVEVAAGSSVCAPSSTPGIAVTPRLLSKAERVEVQGFGHVVVNRGK